MSYHMRARAHLYLARHIYSLSLSLSLCRDSYQLTTIVVPKLGLHFSTQSGESWTATGLAVGCFPPACTHEDIATIAQHVVDEWVPNVTDTYS